MQRSSPVVKQNALVVPQPTPKVIFETVGCTWGGWHCNMTDETSAPVFPTMEEMKLTRRWLLSNASKVPFYVDGGHRSGTLDSPEDVERLGTFDQAVGACALKGDGWNLGFALGPDGSGNVWQGIDLDDIPENNISDLANELPGYVERSIGQNGAHAVGYGRSFATLGSNGRGIEAYSSGRYFIVTNCPIRDGGLACLADYVETVLAPRHRSNGLGMADATQAFASTHVTPRTVTDLRSALNYLRADDRSLWIKIGMALKELGECGHELWLTWSQSSEKFDPLDAERVWGSFKPNATSYREVFAEAQRQGWINPNTNAANASPLVKVAIEEFHARRPRNFLNTATAPALDIANLPDPISEFACAYSAAFGFDVSGVIMAAIAAAAAMIDDAYMLEAKPGWLISARLWVVLIGKSATGKSPTIKAATQPIKSKHAELVRSFHDSPRRADDPPKENPPVPALYTSDATIEALSEKLGHNPRGIMMITEEFSSWIGSIDAYGRGEAQKSRGNWLQLYDGGPFQVDRIKRGATFVPNWGASVLTATTPSALADHMKKLPEDGLLQRFIPVMLDLRNFDADGDATAEIEAWEKALLWIFEKHGKEVVRMSPEAAQLFKDVEIDLGQCASAMDDISPALASHFGKHGEMIARIALVFHVFENSGGNVLSASTLQNAIRLMRQLRKHSVSLYTDILGGSSVVEVARALARSIAAADPPLTAIGRNWMTQHCRAFGKAENDRVRREAVQMLEDLDWLYDSNARTYGGWPTRFEVHPNIYRLYAREGEMHRTKRAAVKAQFGDQIDE